MPEFIVYNRGKNSKLANPVNAGKPVKAVDAAAACDKMAKANKYLRRSRLMALPATGDVVIDKPRSTVTATIVGEPEPMTPEEMKAMLQGSKINA